MRKVVALSVLMFLLVGCAKWPPLTSHTYSPPTSHTSPSSRAYPTPAETIKLIMDVRFIHGLTILEEWRRITTLDACKKAIASAIAFNAAQMEANSYQRIYVRCILNPRDRKA